VRERACEDGLEIRARDGKAHGELARGAVSWALTRSLAGLGKQAEIGQTGPDGAPGGGSEADSRGGREGKKP